MNIDIKSYVGLLKKYLERHRVLLLLLFLVCIGYAVSVLVAPTLLGRFVDSVKEGKSIDTLLMIGMIYLLGVTAENSLSLLSSYLAENLGWNATNDLRIDLTGHLMSLDSSYHKQYSSGQLVERIDGDVEQLFIFFTTFTTGIVLNALQIAGCLIYLFILDVRFFLIQLILVVLTAVYLKIIRKPVNTASAKTRELSSEYFGIISEQVTSIEDIRSLGAWNFMRNLLRKTARPLSYWLRRQLSFEFLSWGTLDFLTGSAMSAVLALSSVLILRGTMGTGKLFLVFNLMLLIQEPVELLREELQYMESAEASIGRIKELFAAESTIPSGDKEMNGDTGIVSHAVSFSYEDGRKVLEDVSFNLQGGKILGLLGRTGSGKTTLARLLVRLYVPEEGNLSYGNIPLNEISEESLRKNVSYVTQEIQTFSGTIRDNITLYDDSISDEGIMETIKKAGMESWFAKLSEGLDTEISDDVNILSPGEMQLLVILRVFLKDPEVIILDEATAKLDPVTERYLENALNVLLKDRTTIIIAHRLKTVMRSDEIIILEGGRILEKGRKEDLTTDKNSHFSSLLRTGLEEVLA